MKSFQDIADAGRRIVIGLSGTWQRDRGVCRCPAHDDRVPSLSVRVGDRSLLFKCFAGCDTAAVLGALRARRWDVPRRDDDIPAGQVCKTDARSLERTLRLWSDSRPLAGTIAEAYLRGRQLHTLPAALRFHPLCPIGQGRSVRFRPAMLAAVTGDYGFYALQRVFLEPDGSALARDLDAAKVSLGRLRSGAVRLSPAGPELGLAEGIETAMSATALLGIPVWAALGSTRLHAVGVPPIVRRLVLLPDNDRAGRIAVDKAAAAYAGPDLDLSIEWPPEGFNDWNDVIRRHARGERRGGR